VTVGKKIKESEVVDSGGILMGEEALPAVIILYDELLLQALYTHTYIHMPKYIYMI
jgi:hypothetical protein